MHKIKYLLTCFEKHGTILLPLKKGLIFCTLQREAKLFRNTGRCRNESKSNDGMH